MKQNILIFLLGVLFVSTIWSIFTIRQNNVEQYRNNRVIDVYKNKVVEQAYIGEDGYNKIVGSRTETPLYEIVIIDGKPYTIFFNNNVGDIKQIDQYF